MSEKNNASDTGNVVEPAVTATVAPGARATIDEPAATATTAHAASSSHPQPPPKQPGSRSGSVFGFLLTLLLLLAVVALGYGYWQQKLALDSFSVQYAGIAEQVGSRDGQFTNLQGGQQQINSGLQDMDSRLQALESSLPTMQQQLQQTVAQQEQNQQQAQQQLLTQLGETNSRIVSLVAQLNTVNAEVASMRQQVGQIGNRTADAVMLNEAESLVALAQQRLLVASDLNSARTLLASSDDLLTRIRSVDVSAARRALAADLASINAVTEVNVASLYQQLADLRSQVNNMNVISGSDNPEFAVPQTDGAEQEETGWLDSALSVLGEYFVVTRQDVEVVPLLTEGQQFLLRQNIELQLTSAQLALLNAEPGVYRTALAAARDGITQWLQGPDDTKASVLDTLGRLQETPIVVSMPDISASLNAIRQIVPVVSLPAAPAAEAIP